MTDQEFIAYTYEDAAKRCGVSSETIRQRARRGKLRKGRPTNTNRPTVLLTETDIQAISSGRYLRTDQPGHTDSYPSAPPSELPYAVRALEDHVSTLREQLGKQDAAYREHLTALREQLVSQDTAYREQLTILREQLTQRDAALAAAKAETEQARGAGELDWTAAMEERTRLLVQVERLSNQDAVYREQLTVVREQLMQRDVAVAAAEANASQTRRSSESDRAAAMQERTRLFVQLERLTDREKANQEQLAAVREQLAQRDVAVAAAETAAEHARWAGELDRAAATTERTRLLVQIEQLTDQFSEMRRLPAKEVALQAEPLVDDQKREEVEFAAPINQEPALAGWRRLWRLLAGGKLPRSGVDGDPRI